MIDRGLWVGALLRVAHWEKVGKTTMEVLVKRWVLMHGWSPELQAIPDKRPKHHSDLTLEQWPQKLLPKQWLALSSTSSPATPKVRRQ